jgi:hypothetical protein
MLKEDCSKAEAGLQSKVEARAKQGQSKADARVNQG